MSSANYAYMLRCRDGSLYTGWTTDLDQRLKAHNAGQGAKYTRSRRPVTLVWYECFPDRRAAMRREAAVKRLSRAEKLLLIAGADRALPREDGENKARERRDAPAEGQGKG